MQKICDRCLRRPHDLPLFHHSMSGVVALATTQLVCRTCIAFLLCDLIYITQFPEKLYTSLFCVLFLRSLSHLMTKHSLTQLSSARLISIWSHLVTEELVLSGCYSLFFPTALLNHFIFITCLAGAHPLTFDSLRPTWDRDEIDCQECGRGG